MRLLPFALISAAPASRRAIGPAEIVLFGTALPVWSLILGTVGVVMARRVAPASAAGTALGQVGNAALTILLLAIVVAVIVEGEKRPIVALGWAIGLGFSGLGAIEMIARAALAAGRLAIEGVVAAASKGAAMWADRRENGK